MIKGISNRTVTVFVIVVVVFSIFTTILVTDAVIDTVERNEPAVRSTSSSGQVRLEVPSAPTGTVVLEVQTNGGSSP